MEPEVAMMAKLLRGTHDRFRAAVRGLDSETLTQTPGPGTNSIGVCVRHTLRSEASMLGRLADRQVDRNYAEDFLNLPTSESELLAQLDQADHVLEDFGAAIPREALDRTWERPSGHVFTGVEWLVHHYGHANEHVAHAELTRQLLSQRAATAR
jgi:DinB superfamily